MIIHKILKKLSLKTVSDRKTTESMGKSALCKEMECDNCVFALGDSCSFSRFL